MRCSLLNFSPKEYLYRASYLYPSIYYYILLYIRAKCSIYFVNIKYLKNDEGIRGTILLSSFFVLQWPPMLFQYLWNMTADFGPAVRPERFETGAPFVIWPAMPIERNRRRWSNKNEQATENTIFFSLSLFFRTYFITFY